MESRLSSFQWRILRVLAGTEPSWTLTGGGALAGIYLGHRATRDLDLFWHSLSQLPNTYPIVERLQNAGYDVVPLRTSPTFVQLRVSDGKEVTVVDLVADPVPTIETPQVVVIEDLQILVDTPHEILINKLCALLSRSEYRDLVDLEALITNGLDWKRALVEAERKDGGFSAATLAWVVHDLPLRALGRAAGAEETQIKELLVFRDRFVLELAALSRPRSG